MPDGTIGVPVPEQSDENKAVPVMVTRRPLMETHSGGTDVGVESDPVLPEASGPPQVAADQVAAPAQEPGDAASPPRGRPSMFGGIAAISRSATPPPPHPPEVPKTDDAPVVPLPEETAPNEGNVPPGLVNLRRPLMTTHTGGIVADPANDDDPTSPRKDTPDVEPPAAGGEPSLATAVNPPMNTVSAVGATQVTDDERLRAAGGNAGEEVAKETAEKDKKPPGGPDAPKATGTEDAEPKPEDDEDPLAKFSKSGDVLLDFLMDALRGPRDESRAQSTQKIVELRQKRAVFADTLSRVNAREDMKIQASAARGGGGGGNFLSGIAGALAAPFKQDPVRSATLDLAAAESELSSATAFRRIALDDQYVRMMDSAHRMYGAHSFLSQGIEALNAGMANHPKGAKFVADVQAAAAERGVDAAEVWKGIHNANVRDPVISGLRDQATALLREPAIGAHVGALENASKAFSANAEAFGNGFRKAVLNGIDMSSVGDAVPKALEGMKSPDSALARPGGEHLEDTSGRMRDTAQKLAAALRAMLESFKRIFGGGGPAPKA